MTHNAVFVHPLSWHRTLVVRYSRTSCWQVSAVCPISRPTDTIRSNPPRVRSLPTQGACRAILALLAHPEADSPLNCDAGQPYCKCSSLCDPSNHVHCCVIQAVWARCAGEIGRGIPPRRIFFLLIIFHLLIPLLRSLGSRVVGV